MSARRLQRDDDDIGRENLPPIPCCRCAERWSRPSTPPKAAPAHERCVTNAFAGYHRASRPGCHRQSTPVTRRWLLRSRSSYAEEVKAIAAELDFSGIWFLNGCYQWGCTALSREQDGASWIARTL